MAKTLGTIESQVNERKCWTAANGEGCIDIGSYLDSPPFVTRYWVGMVMKGIWESGEMERSNQCSAEGQYHAPCGDYSNRKSKMRMPIRATKPKSPDRSAN
jgi:hypothetical protein